jgi:hypothetical protein
LAREGKILLLLFVMLGCILIILGIGKDKTHIT